MYLRFFLRNLEGIRQRKQTKIKMFKIRNNCNIDFTKYIYITFFLSKYLHMSKKSSTFAM